MGRRVTVFHLHRVPLPARRFLMTLDPRSAPITPVGPKDRETAGGSPGQGGGVSAGTGKAEKRRQE